MIEISPRTNTALFGHAAAEAMLLGGFESGRLAHGWIIAGSKGIGKATLAFRFARALLTSPSPRGGEGRGEGESNLIVSDTLTPSPGSSPGQALTLPPNGGGDMEAVSRRIAANSHADLLVIEPLYDEKKEEYAREISVEQARRIGQFLSLTPGEGEWRVVIVDSADALNANAANAILKILEEPPPQAVLLLISHTPGRLLPTIRSRCRTLRLKPLSQEDFERAARHAAPDIGSSELEMLAELSAYSPGVALEMCGQGAVEIYEDMLELLSLLPDLNPASLHAFADRTASGQVHAAWRLFARLALELLHRAGASAAGAAVNPISEAERRALSKLAALHPAHLWAAKWQEAADQFSLAERLHLDYKQVIIAFFHSIMSKELSAASGQ